jgi:hypothetical protein
MIPPAGSGARRFFMEQIGLPESELGVCVATAQDNDYSVVDADANAIMLFSAARYLSSTPFVNGEPVIALRDRGFDFHPSLRLHNAVRTPGGTGYDPLFDPIFGAGGWLCSEEAGAILESHGFGRLDGVECGVKTTI